MCCIELASKSGRDDDRFHTKLSLDNRRSLSKDEVWVNSHGIITLCIIALPCVNTELSAGGVLFPLQGMGRSRS
jgi:hypothetical protein